MKSFLSMPNPILSIFGEGLTLKIICADDSYYELEMLRLVLKDLRLLTYCDFVPDGQQAINKCIKAAEDNINSNNLLVTVIIVDYEMPCKTGIEVINEVRSFYTFMNNKIAAENLISSFNADDDRNFGLLQVPKFCMFTGHRFKGFLDFLKEYEIDCFI